MFKLIAPRIFTVFGHFSSLENIVLYRGAWVAAVLGSQVRIEDHKNDKIVMMIQFKFIYIF